MAAILSASKIDFTKWKAAIFNQKVNPSTVAGEAGLVKFENYMDAAMDMGLDMIQFNVIDKKTLIAAQNEPAKYEDLVVRVSGFNSHFIDLSKFVQDAVIERTEHML